MASDADESRTSIAHGFVDRFAGPASSLIDALHAMAQPHEWLVFWDARRWHACPSPDWRAALLTLDDGRPTGAPRFELRSYDALRPSDDWFALVPSGLLRATLLVEGSDDATARVYDESNGKRWSAVCRRLTTSIRDEATIETAALEFERAPSRSYWRDGVREIVRACNDGRLSKAVLATSACVALRAEPSPGTLVSSLGTRDGSLRFLIGTGGHWVVGATPELLLRRDGRKLGTEALAGTFRGDDLGLAAAALESSKIVREHDEVVRGIVDAIAPMCEQGSLQVGDVEFRRIDRLVHRRRSIHAALRDPSSETSTVLDVLAPTPAVCGAPREAARSLLTRLERHPRGVFAGVIGWHEPNGGSIFAVPLRLAHVMPERRARLYAGAGIVQGSDADDEYEEVLAKMLPMRQALARVDARSGVRA